MNDDRKPPESAKAVIHETVADVFEPGIGGKQTMRTFDEMCLTPVHDFTSEESRDLRARHHVVPSG